MQSPPRERVSRVLNWYFSFVFSLFLFSFSYRLQCIKVKKFQVWLSQALWGLSPRTLPWCPCTTSCEGQEKKLLTQIFFTKSFILISKFFYSGAIWRLPRRSQHSLSQSSCSGWSIAFLEVLKHDQVSAAGTPGTMPADSQEGVYWSAISSASQGSSWNLCRHSLREVSWCSGEGAQKDTTKGVTSGNPKT